MTRQVNAAAPLLIRQFEGCRLSAYQDAAGVWSIGYGHTAWVKQDDTCTQAQADAWLEEDAASVAGVIEKWTDATATSDNEFAAMVSLAFNIGPTAFAGSSVLKFHRANDKIAAADAFLTWDKAHVNGRLQQVDGLLRRRQAERALYLENPLVVLPPLHGEEPASSQPLPLLPQGTRVMQDNKSSHAAALAAIMIFNWLLAQISPHWAMPADVQASAQTLVTLGFAWLLGRKFSNPSRGSGSSGVPSSVDQATPKA